MGKDKNQDMGRIAEQLQFKENFCKDIQTKYITILDQLLNCNSGESAIFYIGQLKGLDLAMKRTGFDITLNVGIKNREDKK